MTIIKTTLRQQLIEYWAQVIASQAGIVVSMVSLVAVAYMQLAVSQCMDAAILHRAKLDLKVEEGAQLDG